LFEILQLTFRSELGVCGKMLSNNLDMANPNSSTFLGNALTKIPKQIENGDFLTTTITENLFEIL